MSVHGFGLGASVVGGFSDAHKSAIKAGFPDTIDTYGLVSGLWTSVFAFGAFVGEREYKLSIRRLHLRIHAGPTFGGILFDAVTFRWAIFLVIIGELISLVMLISYLCVELCGSSPPSPPASLASDTDQVTIIILFSLLTIKVIPLELSFCSCQVYRQSGRVTERRAQRSGRG